jgi:amino acid adenylation domain-containing protein
MLQLSLTYDEGTHRRETVERLAGAYLAALRALIAHCREAGARGYTPSDFPLAGLTQAQVDAVTAGARAVEELYPLAPLQEGLLFHGLYGTGSQAYQVQLAQRLEGSLDVGLLRRAWAEVARRHPILRTSFVWRGLPRPLQRVESEVEVPWVVEDWTDRAPAEQEAALERFLEQDRAAGFRLDQAPLMRLALIRVGPEAWWVVWNQHHLLLDGWSTSRVVAEVFRLYGAWAAGDTVELKRPRPYRDYIAWVERQDAGAAERHWRGVLEGFAAPTPLPADRPAEPGAAPRYDRRSALLSPEATTRLEEAARRHQVTLNTLLQGAWGILLSQYAGEDDVVFGITVSGRQAELEGVEEMVGLFINTLPVRMRARGGERVGAWLGGVQRAQAEAREYEYAPLVQVQGWSQVPRGTPLFESLMVFENYPVERAGGGGGAGPRLRVTGSRAVEWTNYPLTLVAAPGTRLLLALSFDEGRFDATTGERVLRHLERLLERMADGADRPLAELELVDAAERRKVVEEWNRTAAPYPADRCIHHLFEAQAARTPGAAAVVHGGRSVSYRELDEGANRLARHLRGLGVGPEVRVGICLERSPELLVAILGVMKAGGAYVPADPAHPGERIGYVLDDAGVAVLLTQARLLARVPVRAGVEVVTLEERWARIAAESAEAVDGGAGPGNLAYVIYTSGSTGRPKGVAMHHRGVCNYLDWGVRAYGAGEGNGAPVFSSMAVDLTITNLLPLFAGRPVLLLPEENAVEALAEALRGAPDFGLIKITPTHLSLLTALLSPGDARGAARTLVVGADLLLAEHTRFWREHAPDVPVLNEYGPTETVVGCSAYLLPPGRHREGVVPVGGPIQNLTFYVLNQHGAPVPADVPGELYIGGVGVARGYLGRPALTAGKFVPDPFAGGGARMYRTGDRARWRDDGNLMILGRTDNQVKIRGYRVEPGEIEAALRRHPAVRAALVVVREDAPGDRRLVAYVVAGPAAGEAEAADPAALREHLRRSLPEHMVPGAFVLLDALPQTPTGKLDPRALPAPELASPAERYVAPRSGVEEALAEIWAEVLRLERAGVTENFFELGGHSILAIRVVSHVREIFGVELPLHTLFDVPTIAGLAELLATDPRYAEGAARVEALMLQVREMEGEAVG